MDIETPSPSPPRSRVAHALFIALLVTAAVASVRRATRDAPADLAALPPAVREGLRDRTTANLRAICAVDRGPAIERFCRAQAEVLLRLPECDAACAAEAEKLVPHATR